MENATSAADVYHLCLTHDELLRHNRLPVVKKLCAALRSFKRDRRDTFVTPADAFNAHRQFVLLNAELDKPKRQRRGITFAIAVPEPSSPLPARTLSPPAPPQVNSDPQTPLSPICVACDGTADTRLLPCRHDEVCGACCTAMYNVAREKQRKRSGREQHLRKQAVVFSCPICQAAVLSLE